MRLNRFGHHGRRFAEMVAGLGEHLADGAFTREIRICATARAKPGAGGDDGTGITHPAGAGQQRQNPRCSGGGGGGQRILIRRGGHGSADRRRCGLDGGGRRTGEQFTAPERAGRGALDATVHVYGTLSQPKVDLESLKKTAFKATLSQFLRDRHADTGINVDEVLKKLFR